MYNRIVCFACDLQKQCAPGLECNSVHPPVANWFGYFAPVYLLTVVNVSFDTFIDTTYDPSIRAVPGKLDSTNNTSVLCKDILSSKGGSMNAPRPCLDDSVPGQYFVPS